RAAIGAAGVEAVGVATDIATADGARLLIATALEKLGRVDILVNNAGVNISQGMPAWEVAPSDLVDVLRVNVAGPYLCAAEMIRQWLARGSAGRIINVSSGAGERAFPKLAPYGISKFGLEGLTRYLALDVG